MDSDIIYVLCTFGGEFSYEPFVAVFSTEEAARDSLRNLPNDHSEMGGQWFIERQRVNVPGEYESIASGSSEEIER